MEYNVANREITGAMSSILTPIMGDAAMNTESIGKKLNMKEIVVADRIRERNR